MAWRFARGAAALLFGCCGLVALMTAIAVVVEPMPEVLRARTLARGTLVTDRHDQRIGQLRNADFELAIPLTLDEVPEVVLRAVVATEDARFYRHRGFDPFAIGRAAWQWIRHGRIVSGGSTLTQQLARSVAPRPRSVFGKWRELVVALRIETEFDKSRILEAYLNHVAFGPNTRGIAAAADEVFGKPVAVLSTGEAAALAALPRGPSHYHPSRQQQRLLVRRHYVLERMLELGLVDGATFERADREPLVVREPRHFGGSLHFLRAISQGRLDARFSSPTPPARIQTTLDANLQGRVEKLVDDAAEQLDAVAASGVAVVVLDNERAALRAYVGSRGFFDAQRLGQNDGCLALRQPGSTLKPFVYAAAFDTLAMTPTTQLFDVETSFQTSTGPFTPRNYDGRYHGLVLLREALASSLNVPAVAVIERVGVERQLALFHRFGFHSLNAPASHYGLALALGDGEVRLVELANAYATLARHGTYLPLRAIERWTDAAGVEHSTPKAAPTRVVSALTADRLLEILSDDSARAPSFGRHGTLDLAFPAATKTGTSSNHRDNWAVAVTHEFTVAVWVGNFDGRPLLHGSSGVVGAAPLMRQVMEAAMLDSPIRPLVPPSQLQLRRICKISGQAPNAWCPDVVEIRSVTGSEVPPEGRCTLHERVRIDSQNGLRAGPACRDAIERTLEHYPEPVAAWARDVGRPVLPVLASPRCPSEPRASAGGVLEVLVPAPGARYLIDPHLPEAQQQLEFEVRVPADTRSVKYEVDGKTTGDIFVPFRWKWRLSRGNHRLRVLSASGDHVETDFSVH
jgi:penicillin-binding protein 1C